MKKSNEINTIAQSSEQAAGASRRQAPAPTLMYLIELDPNVSSCLAGGSLPLQMLNVNQNNTHYLIPLQATDPLEVLQYKQREESQAEPSVSSDVRVETNITGTNRKLRSKQSKAVDLYAHEDATKSLAGYGSSIVDLKSNIKGSDESFELSPARERLSALPLDEQSLTASGAESPARKCMYVSDSVPPPRAVLTLPAPLRLHRGRVTPRKPLPPACFGPVRVSEVSDTRPDDGLRNRPKLVGDSNYTIRVERDISCEEARELVLKAAAKSKPVFLLSKGDGFRLIDVSDPEQSNWFSLLPLGCARSANVWLQQRGAALLACSRRRLQPRAALRLGYAASLADKLRLPPDLPDLPVLAEHREGEEPIKRCAECGQELEGPPLRHECPEVFKSNRRKRRYRCKHCALPFSRLFTLKRHMSLHCKSKTVNTSPQAEPPPAPAEFPLSASAGRAEEDRLHSEDSFHYSLDFSAPLFDPDTVPLDDNLLQHQETNTCTPDVHIPPIDYSKKVAKTASLIKCPHCQLTMSSNMKQRHKRQCVRRLARHVHKHKSPQSEVESTGASYTCDQCQNTFKRRGMLVNHVWRVHGSAARVPLQRRQRHYPCGACSKLYRSAAKRDRHARAYHPGAELVRAPAIDSGAVECEPAVCSACPRQYATRAKLLQHVRRHHPHLAPPLKSKLPKKAKIDPSLC